MTQGTTMAAKRGLTFDEIGYWSEVKLAIVKEYAAAYSHILAGQKKHQLHHVYVDAFAGAGAHLSKTTGEMVPGSPLNALAIKPPFKEYHLIDLDGAKVENLRSLVGARADVSIHEGDCNEVLLKTVFPRVLYEDFRRGLCLLDPYGLTLRWEVVERAGKMRSIEIFLNFPIMDMNRNALWSDPTGVAEEDAARMTSFWGDESWKQAAYAEQTNIFGGIDPVKYGGNAQVVGAYRERLKKVAGFKYVPEPMPMRNTKGAVVYYLFFASQNATGKKIVESIFHKYKTKGAT
jgi:three-Cys-motif partner protein